MRALADVLAELGAHPRAVPWRIRALAGWGTAAPVREHVVFAPALGRSVWPVLARAHNAALLHNAAAIELVAPVPEAELEPVLGRIRSVHNIPFVIAPARPQPARRVDVPSVDLPTLVPPGPGLALGLDIGGTSMKVVALDGTSIVGSAGAPTWPDGERGIDSLVARGRELVVVAAAGRPIGSLGIGLAAPMGVGGQVLELSTILRERVGDATAFVGFAERIAVGIVNGPVVVFNDLSNLGRHLSDQGARRMVRVQLGTSFGGCWIDGDGAVVATEMGRLVVDVGPDARPHTYLPLTGAMRTYLSNVGVAGMLAASGMQVVPAQAGHALRDALVAGEAAGLATVESMAEVMVGVCREFATLLIGVQAVECGGSMLQGPAGVLLARLVQARSPLAFDVASRPGEDGAIAAALAPRVSTPLRGVRRLGGPG
ncbi:MAG: ROK family protein [Myxococcales bacterium]|nr:ROK family protein [Myxococcales bacterium]